MTSAAPTRAGAPARVRTRGAHRPRPFVAVDGEAVDERGEHRYVVLTSSTGDTYVDTAGIATRDALNWLLRLGREHDAIFVAFGLNYDVNMILRDLTADELRELWTSGELDTTIGEREYLIEWVPGKLFAVGTHSPDARTQVYDVFGFFQTSFVNALDKWGRSASDTVRRLKAARGTFRLDDLDAITAYSIEENVELVELMEQVRAALHAVELKPRSWLGAGAIASTLLAKHKVDEHMPRRYDRPLTITEDVLPRAYFGGRTEIFLQGDIGDATALDINSAYPAEAAGLPSAIGRWRRSRRYEPDEPWAVWRVRWRLPAGTLLAPFPFRDRRSIHYPLAGEGWYHACELAAARELYGDAITVTSGYVYEPAGDAQPFAFLHDVYAERQALKADGHAGEKVLKLGINSVYGKLAQGSGRDGRIPRFQDYFWAGRITAGCRARALRCAALNVDELVSIATDGLIFAGAGPNVDERAGLGGWERTRYRRLFVAQPGMYHATLAAGRRTVKHSRGFFTKEVRFGALRKAWAADGPFGAVPCRSHRFIGLGTALMRTDGLDTLWRTWEDSTRTITLMSSRKHYDGRELGRASSPAMRLYPPSDIRPGLSDRYVPKRAAVELDDEQAEWVQGMEQPLDVF